MITLKVIRVPGTVKEIALEDGATVADALAAAEYEPSATEAITLNGATVSTDAVVNDSDRLVLAKAAKSA